MNRDFHDAIILAFGNRRLTDAIYNLGRSYLNGPAARLATGDELSLGNAEHARIVTALLDRDGAAAEFTMRTHIMRTFAVYGRTNEMRSANAAG